MCLMVWSRSRVSSYLGLLHSLSADWTPVPQVLEQWDHVLHCPQPPFTVSGSLPTITHSPEIHHWRRKAGKITQRFPITYRRGQSDDQPWRSLQATFQANCRDRSVWWPLTSVSKPHLTSAELGYMNMLIEWCSQQYGRRGACAKKERSRL